MPTLKIYIDTALDAAQIDACAATLEQVQSIICTELRVTPMDCHLSLIPVRAVAGQVSINAEMHVLPRPERTREVLTALATRLKALLSDAAGAKAAVRISQHDATTFLALK